MNQLHSPLFSRGRFWRALGLSSIVLVSLMLILGALLAGGNIVKADDEAQDFGDAPEPTYPTTIAGNGASHKILQGFSLGASVDGEPDGQPSFNADGDDAAASDDEDGVTFLSSLVPGLETCIDVGLTNSAGVPNAYLDAWIDFNGDGYWDVGAEHLWGGTSQPLFSGSNVLCFLVPPDASRGPTYARFRLSDIGSVPPDGPSPGVGEVEDYFLYIEFTKWEQPPTKHKPEDTCYWGWDEVSIYNSPGEPGFPIVADDWECRGPQPVTDIHWWGSYAGWNDIEQPFTPPPTQLPTKFHIGIWTDVPYAPPEVQFSHPDQLIKEWIVDRNSLNEHYAGCDSYGGNTETCFYYEFKIPPEEWFFQNPDKDKVYWLSIAAIYPNNEPPQQYQWGWLTRKPEWNDDAVRIFTPNAPQLGDTYTDGEPIETQEEGSWDTSFVLTSQPTEPRAPQVKIEITQTVNAKLSWSHVVSDTLGGPITVNRYYIYRDTSPYQGASATLHATIDGPFAPSDITFFDPGAIGNASTNYFYYVQAAISDNHGGYVTSVLSNHVGEFDFTLVPGSS